MHLTLVAGVIIIIYNNNNKLGFVKSRARDMNKTMPGTAAWTVRKACPNTKNGCNLQLTSHF
jgi:hypothetical protein